MLSAPERMIVPEPWPRYFTDVLASAARAPHLVLDLS